MFCITCDHYVFTANKQNLQLIVVFGGYMAMSKTRGYKLYPRYVSFAHSLHHKGLVVFGDTLELNLNT